MEEYAKCLNCRFYDEVSWHCRRHAPVMAQDNRGFYQTWPTVRRDDWCGDHEEKK